MAPTSSMTRGTVAVVAVVIAIVGGSAIAWFTTDPAAASSSAQAGAGQQTSSGSGAGSATSTGGSGSASGSGSAAATIRSDWQRFFSSRTPTRRRIALLQHGQRFVGALRRLASSPLAAQVAARVRSVRRTGPRTAAVTYDIVLGGKPALKGRSGTALLRHGTWKVSDAAFCQLVALSGSRPPACPAPSRGGGGSGG